MNKKLNKLVCTDVKNVNDWELINTTRKLFYESGNLNKRSLISNLLILSVILFPWLAYFIMHNLSLNIIVDLALLIIPITIEIYLIKITGLALNVYLDYNFIIKEKFIEAKEELVTRGYKIESGRYIFKIKKEN